MPTALVFFIGVVLLIVFGSLYFARREKARTAEWQQAARSIGFEFHAEVDFDQFRREGDLALFDIGYWRKVRNLLSGRMGNREVKVFDYEYTSGKKSEKGGSQTWQQTIALYPTASRSLPDFQLMAENQMTRWANKKAAAYPDVTFESQPAFSSRYLLRGPNEPAVRAAFTNERIAFFEKEQGWVVEVKAGTVGVYRAGERIRPADLQTFLGRAQAVLEALAPR